MRWMDGLVTFHVAMHTSVMPIASVRLYELSEWDGSFICLKVQCMEENP